MSEGNSPWDPPSEQQKEPKRGESRLQRTDAFNQKSPADPVKDEGKSAFDPHAGGLLGVSSFLHGGCKRRLAINLDGNTGAELPP